MCTFHNSLIMYVSRSGKSLKVLLICVELGLHATPYYSVVCSVFSSKPALSHSRAHFALIGFHSITVFSWWMGQIKQKSKDAK